jgi:hypothetical protein
MGRKSASGSGIRNEQAGSYFLELRNHFLVFWGFKYLNSLMRIRDGDSSDPGSGMEKSWIRDKHPGSATLLKSGSSPGIFFFLVFFLNLIVLHQGHHQGLVLFAFS